jgi:hypothetical protein
MILIKIRLLDVVSSSFSLMYPSTVHGMASVVSRKEKNWRMEGGGVEISTR